MMNVFAFGNSHELATEKLQPFLLNWTVRGFYATLQFSKKT